jgi:TolB protein
MRALIPDRWLQHRTILLGWAVMLSVMPSAHAGIAYTILDQDNTWTVYYQDQPNTKPLPIAKPISGDASAPCLSGKSQRVAFEIQGAGIYLCRLNAHEDCYQIRIPEGHGARPTWWADTGNLVFARYIAEATGEDSEIFVTNEKSNKLVPLVTQTGLLDYPDISGDGRYLAYAVSGTVGRYQGGVQVIQSLWVMDLETGRVRQVLLSEAQDIHPDWSPSGKKLALASNRSGRFEIWVVDADGNELRQVTSGPGSKTWPAWSPDGKSILFTLHKDGRYSLWLIDADGAHLRPFQPFGPESNLQLRDADWK